MRALLCRHGVEQMRADADEAVRRFAAESFVTPTPALQQGIARILCGDLDGGDTCLEDAVSVGEQIGSPEHVAVGLCERSLVAMARSQWDRAEVLADQARTVLRRAGIEESYATPLVSAVRARTAMHRADLPAVHQELARAQRLRHLLTYALPHFAVQARIELARVHLALADLAGARTLMREVDDLLRRRPGLGTLVGEAGALRAQLAKDRGSSVPGASALTAAELRLLPLLSTHLSFPRDRRGDCSCPATRSSRRRCRSTASWAPPHAARPSPGPVSSASWRDDSRSFVPSGGWNPLRHEVSWCRDGG